MKRLFLLLPAALALSACAAAGPEPSALAPPLPDPVTVRIIGINDFHGNLEPPARPVEVAASDGGERLVVPAGGAAYLASAIAERRAQGQHSMVISAGDMISGSPLISSLFLDEPTIGVMNRIGIDFNAVGNHEFDRGRDELLRIQHGGCEVFALREPCQVENPYPGADFAFLAANVTDDESGETLFPGSALRRFGTGEDAIAVGVIGLTLKGTPSLVTPSGIAGLSFTDEADAINARVPALLEQGAHAIVVAIHEGLYRQGGFNEKSCDGVSGPLLDILSRLDSRVNIVISGHTHRTYICDYGTIDPARPFLVTSAGHSGLYLTDIALTIDPGTGRVVGWSADNVIVQNQGITLQDGQVEPVSDFTAFEADPEIAAYVGLYADAARDRSERVVGRIAGDARRPATASSETGLGNLIADAQLHATHDAGAQIALMNNSGIRAAIAPASDGSVSFGALYAVQPFSNMLVTKSFSGAQLLAVLEQQFDGQGLSQTFSVSEGFAFSYDMSRPQGSRIVSAELNGRAIDPAATYRVTMNSFLADGGDNFTGFRSGTESMVGPEDIVALEQWVGAADVRPLPPVGRVRDLTPAE